MALQATGDRAEHRGHIDSSAAGMRGSVQQRTDKMDGLWDRTLLATLWGQVTG
jgi:hypothetical protein